MPGLEALQLLLQAGRGAPVPGQDAPARRVQLLGRALAVVAHRQQRGIHPHRHIHPRQRQPVQALPLSFPLTVCAVMLAPTWHVTGQ